MAWTVINGKIEAIKDVKAKDDNDIPVTYKGREKLYKEVISEMSELQNMSFLEKIEYFKKDHANKMKQIAEDGEVFIKYPILT